MPYPRPLLPFNFLARVLIWPVFNLQMQQKMWMCCTWHLAAFLGAGKSGRPSVMCFLRWNNQSMSSDSCAVRAQTVYEMVRTWKEKVSLINLLIIIWQEAALYYNDWRENCVAATSSSGRKLPQLKLQEWVACVADQVMLLLMSFHRPFTKLLWKSWEIDERRHLSQIRNSQKYLKFFLFYKSSISLTFVAGLICFHGYKIATLWSLRTAVSFLSIQCCYRKHGRNNTKT